MTDISCTYNDEAQGWISDTLVVNQPKILYIDLESKGYVVILQHVNDEWRKAYTTPYHKSFEFTLDKFMDAVEIKIACSEQPIRLQYENI